MEDDFSNLQTDLDGVGFSNDKCLCRLYSESFEIETDVPSYSGEVLQALKDGYNDIIEKTSDKKLFFIGNVPR